MGIIQKFQVAGYGLRGMKNGFRAVVEIVCPDCIEFGEFIRLTEEEVLTRDQVDGDEKLFFCDRCYKTLKWFIENYNPPDSLPDVRSGKSSLRRRKK